MLIRTYVTYLESEIAQELDLFDLNFKLTTANHFYHLFSFPQPMATVWNYLLEKMGLIRKVSIMYVLFIAVTF